MDKALLLASRHPFIFSVSITAFKTGGVDIFVQKYVEKRDEIDWKRNAVFLAFGTLYLGAWQYALFSKIMPSIVPEASAFIAKSWREKLNDGAGLRGLGIQIFLENGINNPVLYFPIFYTLQEVINGGTLSHGVAKYRANMKDDLIDIWKVWVPAQLINFAFTPLWLRVPFVASVSIIWTAYVSFTRGKSTPDKVELMVRSSVTLLSYLKYNSIFHSLFNRCYLPHVLIHYHDL